MISKPVRWRRVGIAALAGVSLALTALAAQVSPPNVSAAGPQMRRAAGTRRAHRHQTTDRDAGSFRRHLQDERRVLHRREA